MNYLALAILLIGSSILLDAGETQTAETVISVPTPHPPYFREMRDRSSQIAINGRFVAGIWTLQDGNNRIATAISADSGTIWSAPTLFDRQRESDHISSHSDVCVAPDSLATAIVRYSKRTLTAALQNWGLYDRRLDQAGSTWTGPRFPMEFVSFDADRWTLLFESPAIASEPESGDTYIAFTARYVSRDSIGGHVAEIRYVGQSEGVWGMVQTLSGPASERARIVFGTDGTMLVYWHDMASGHVVGRRSVDGGRTFGDPIQVGRMVANYSLPPRYLTNEYQQNQVYCQGLLAPHYAAIAVDRSRGPRRGWMYAVWAEAMEGVPEPVVSSASESEPNDIPADANRIEFGQSMAGSSVGTDIAGHNDTDTFYLEGRRGETVHLTGQVTFASMPGNIPYAYCGSGIRLCQWDSPSISRGIVATGAFDHGPYSNAPMIFTLPLDGRYTMNGGFAQANWRIGYALRLQRLLPMPGSVARDHRDIVMVVSRDGGLTWSEKRLVNDDPPWFDNSMPEVAVDGLGRVYVGWYDRRDDPFGLDYHVYWTCSEDGGETFAPSRPLSTRQSVIGPGQWTELGDHWSLVGTEDGIAGAWTFATGEDVGITENEHNIHFRRVSLPVALSVTGLTATTHVQRAELSWRVSSARYLWKFLIGRRPAGQGEFVVIGEVDRSSGGGPLDFSFVDTTVDGADYEYRIEAVLANEVSVFSDPVLAGVPPTPTALELRVRSARAGEPVVFDLASPVRGSVELRIFDVQGSPVRTVGALTVEPGPNEVTWDVRGAGGHPVPAGVYFIEATIGPHRTVLKLVVTR
jgi:hypothetical protein